MGFNFADRILNGVPHPHSILGKVLQNGKTTAAASTKTKQKTKLKFVKKGEQFFLHPT